MLQRVPACPHVVESLSKGAPRMCLTGCTPSDRPGSGTDPAGTCTGSVSECPTVCPENPVIEFIRQNNAIFPSAGDDACHMVSKFVTDVNLPGSATFTGPPGPPQIPTPFGVRDA